MTRHDRSEMNNSAASHGDECAKPIGLRERSRRERYARIRTAAEELFSEKGYHEVTTKEVAKRAGVGEATLFRYITNKEELLLLVVGERSEALLDEIEAEDDRFASGQDAEHDGSWYLSRIYRIYRTRVDFFASDPEQVSSYLSCGLKSESALGVRSTASGDRVIERVRAILAEAQGSGALRDDVNPLIVARNCNGTYIHEILRIPARRLPFESTWDRLLERLDAMLRPLVLR